MTRVMGLDLSANRIAWGICDSVKFIGSGRVSRRDMPLTRFVMDACAMIANASASTKTTTACIEINLHPKILYKGYVSPTMVRAYMRSRWVEGAVFDRLTLDEPREIIRKKGGYSDVELGHAIYSMAATGGPDAKQKRRDRMLLLYARHQIADLSKDEIDALAIGHDCSVALNLAERGAV